jgi:hypothetical protein
MKTDAYVYIKTTIKRNAHGEWVVRLYLDGERQIGADYFASDRDDAVETADRMREEATASNRDRSLASWLRKRLANDRPGDRDLRKELENLLRKLEGGEA